jgi:hypothetical protein
LASSSDIHDRPSRHAFAARRTSSASAIRCAPASQAATVTPPIGLGVALHHDELSAMIGAISASVSTPRRAREREVTAM